jgi:hypothetical protein
VAALVKTWIHMLCGKPANFKDGIDPNTTGHPCPNCGIPLGGWAPA